MATVFVWPALGTTVTLEDLTVITSAGASVTYTAEIRQNIASGFLLTYDPTGGGVDPDPATSISTIYATTVAALSTIRGSTDTQYAFVECHTTRGDGGGGTFVWDAASTATANGGTILGTGTGRWKRVFSGAVRTAWFGAQSSTVIQSALTAASAAGIAIVEMPECNVTTSASIVVPANMELRGQGSKTILTMPINANYRAVDVDGKSNVTLRSFRITIAAGTEAGGTSTYAVHVRGVCDNVRLHNLIVDGGLRRNISVNGSEGTIAGLCTNVSMRDCISNDCLLTYGFDINHCDGLLLDGCYATNNLLAGFKLRGLTKNVTVQNCIGSGNGNGGSVSGDGLDAYAGGDEFVVSNCTFEDNPSAGMQIKTGALNDDTPLVWGSMVGRFQLIGNRCNRNDYGLIVTLNDYADTTARIPSNIAIIGGDYSENAIFGITFSARNGVLSGVTCRKNGNDGLVIGSRAFDVLITDPIIIANGTASAGTYSGIAIVGSKVTVRGGTIIGVDADSVGQHSDYGALTVYHEHAITVAASCTGVVIDRPVIRYHTSASPCSFDSTSHVIMDWVGAGLPAAGYGLGSPGSTWANTTSAVPGNAFWVKTDGTADQNNVGWRRVISGPAATGANLDFGSIAAGASADLTLTITGAATTDVAVASPQTGIEAGIVWNAFVSAADTVTVRCTNITGAPIDQANRFWSVRTFTQGG